LQNRRGLPAQTSQKLANRFLADTDAPCDLTLRVTLGFELLNQALSRRSQADTPARVATAVTKGCQSTVLEPPLMASKRPHRTTEHPGHVVLIGPALFHQTDHGVRLAHRIAQRVLGQHHTGNNHHPVSILGSDHAPFIEDVEFFRIARVWEEISISGGGHAGRLYASRSKKRTGLGPHSRAPWNAVNAKTLGKPGISGNRGRKSGQVWVRTLPRLKMRISSENSRNHNLYVRSSGVEGADLLFYIVDLRVLLRVAHHGN
jgi:hypothetical protein